MANIDDGYRHYRSIQLLKWYDRVSQQESDKTIFESMSAGGDLRDVEILTTALQARVNEKNKEASV